jgi:chorismate mutase / prephenate dehydratase
MKVAYQGIEGSYSESALLKHFGKDAQAIGLETFDDVFDAVNEGKADFESCLLKTQSQEVLPQTMTCC